MTVVQRKLSRTFKNFFDSEKSSGILLIICTVFSLIVTNSAIGPDYLGLWQIYAGGLSIEHWINDALMAVFFLLIGLELEREFYVGELSDFKNALLPIFAAMGGICLPALIRSAIEELLRYTSPVFMATERYAREDVTIHEVRISQGEMSLGVIGSANRDEKVFDNPDTLDLTREPNRHLSFGYGIHFCLGAPLARLEGQIAINTLLDRMPNLRLKESSELLRWRQSLILRGLEALPVRF